MMPTHRGVVSTAPWTDTRETDSWHEAHAWRDNTQKRALLIALALSVAVSGCLAEPRTDAQLDESISAGAGTGTGTTSTKCSAAESARLLKPKGGVIMATTTCMTRPNNNCIPGSTCVAFCVDNFEVGATCHTCLKKEFAGCVSASCVDACELDAHAPLCPSCVEDCRSCMAKKCAKAIQGCSAD